MIEAKHSSLARFIFNPYESIILKKAFNRFILLNDDFYFNENQSVIFLPNHFSWWDGFFVDFLNRKLMINKKLNIIMLENQLKKYWFFRYLGATGFDPQNPKSIIKLSNYINNLLKSPNNLLVFYPQGEIQYFENDLKIKEGLSYLLKTSPPTIQIFYPFFKIVYFDKRLPDLVCKIYQGLDIKSIVNDYPLFIQDFTSKFYNFRQSIDNIENKRDLFKF